jgi:ABC-2 type transport system ATP-binding protein
MDIQIKQCSHSYGGKLALDQVSLSIAEGMFGLLGPNGAGKTTLMRILTTLLTAGSGEITLGGIPVARKEEIRRIVGYLPQDFSVYPSFTVYETMDYLALLSGLNDSRERKLRIGRLLEQVNLERQAKKKVRSLSGGMKRRLGIAQAMVHSPQVLIVDEPTAGLDPEERIRFRNLLRDFSEGRVVILSTHIVEDIEFTCERVGVLKEGHVLYEGGVKGLLEQAKGAVWTTSVTREELDAVRRSYEVLSVLSEGDRIRVRLLSRHQPGFPAERMEPSIEDAYMLMMGGNGRVLERNAK